MHCNTEFLQHHLIWSLANNNELHFKHDDKKKRAPWWDVPLINWSNYQDTSNATKQIMDGCGVKAAKITHHRTAACSMQALMA